jgi:hypothetical protein
MNEIDAFVRTLSCVKTGLRNGSAIPIPTGDGFGLAFSEDAFAPLEVGESLLGFIKGKDYQVRIGVHIGPATLREANIADQPDLHGAGVNYAARVTGLADPGEMVVSAQAYDVYRFAGGYERRFSDRGIQEIKHGEQIRTYRFLASVQDDRVGWLGRLEQRWADKIYLKRQNADLPVAPIAVIRSRLGHVRRDVLVSVVILLLTFLLDPFLAHSRFGHEVNGWAYERLQSMLPLSESPGVPIEIIDIGKRFDKDDAGTTDLKRLKELLAAISEASPKGVVVDIDFGIQEKEGTWLDQDNLVTEFAYQSTLGGTPISLVVGRGLASQDPQHWLGDERYRSIIVQAFFPREGLGSGLLAFPEELKLGEHTFDSVALRLKKNSGLEASLPPFPSKFVSRYVEHPAHYKAEGDEMFEGKVFGHEYFLNFSALERMKTRIIPVSEAEDISGNLDYMSRLNGSLVLVGSVDYLRDIWIRPDTRKAEAGLLLHAISTYSMTHEPVYQFTEPIKLGITLSALLIILAFVTLARLATIAQPRMVNVGVLSLLLTLVTVLAMLFAGAFLAVRYKVLWVDFVLVGLLVFFHPAMEHRFMRTLVQASSILSAVVKRLFEVKS